MNENMLSGFITPHHDYRPATMWFWNDDLVESEITAQMESFAEKGINDFFVNHVWGATDEYLGERYFEVVKHAVKEAERLGLSFWIYDEFNWPSGVAGGQVLRDHPELRAKAMRDTGVYLLPGMDMRQHYIKGKFLGANIVYRDSLADGPIDVTNEVKVEQGDKGFWISYQNNSCADINFHVQSVQLQDNVIPASRLGKYSFEQEGYIDPLDHKAIRAFIDSTHEKYKAAVGYAFGKTVKGLFTDEVCVAAPHDIGLSRVPWNDAIKETFEKRFGYDLTPWMYALVERPANAQEKKVRYHFWQLMKELVRDAHIKQAYEWCDKENLLYTGHFDGEESITWSMYQSGDIFELMKYMHVPGIDSIYSRTKINDENYNVAGKVVSSCARFYKRDRILCETFTMSTAQLRFDEMRRVVNRLMVLGVNMIQYMGANYSMDNARKAPSQIAGEPSHGDNNTLFKYYDRFGDYVSRVQYLSTKTKPAGRVLMLWAQAAVYVNINGHCNIFAAFDEPTVCEYERTMVSTVNTLLDLNIEYDIFGDSLADEVKAENGVAKFYDNEYDAVILPNTYNTTSGVAAMVNRLKEAGVRMVFIDELPGLAVDTAEAISPLGNAPSAMGLTTIGENIDFIRIPTDEKRRGQNQKYKTLLLSALPNIERTLDIRHDGSIYTGLRTGEGKRVVFMCNDSNAQTSASIAYSDKMQLLDPDRAAKIKLSPKNGRADIFFEPYQMYVLVESDEEIDLPCYEMPKFAPVKELTPYCELDTIGGSFLTASWKHAPYKYDGNAITYPDSFTPIPYHAVPGKYAGVNEEGLIVFDFEMKTLPESVRLFTEYRSILRCELNGVQIDDKWEHTRLWGPHDASMDVAKLLKPGMNRLAAVIKLPDYNTPYRAPFTFFRGEFEAQGNIAMEKRASYTASPLNKQGHEHFAGDAVYRFKTTLTENEAAEIAYLSVNTRDASEVIVNGKSAGVRLWAPHRYNVEGLFKAGENIVEIRTTLPMWNIFSMPGQAIDVGITVAPKLEKKA